MKRYADRKPWLLEPYYSAHVAAMTAEGLHEKSDIVAELAARDLEIARLRSALSKVVEAHNPAAVIAQLALAFHGEVTRKDRTREEPRLDSGDAECLGCLKVCRTSDFGLVCAVHNYGPSQAPGLQDPK